MDMMVVPGVAVVIVASLVIGCVAGATVAGGRAGAGVGVPVVVIAMAFASVGVPVHLVLVFCHGVDASVSPTTA